jgi:hypothetical protein
MTTTLTERPAEGTFELLSQNGSATTVIGTIEHVDREALAYLVRSRTGELVRVPIRDIRSHDVPSTRPA